MCFSDIYIDSDSFYNLIDSNYAEELSFIFNNSRLILEDNDITQMIIEDALTGLHFRGEEGDELPNNNINYTLLSDFGVNLLSPNKVKLIDTVDFYNSLPSPFSIFIKDIKKEKIDMLASRHGFKYFNLKSFIDYYKSSRKTEINIKKESSLFKIPIEFSKERILFINSRYFLDNIARKPKKSKAKYLMRDCFSKYVNTFFGNREKDSFVEICFMSFLLDNIIIETDCYKESIKGKKIYNKEDEKIKSIQYPFELRQDFLNKSSNSAKFSDIETESLFNDLFSQQALKYIFNELKASLLDAGFNNFKITIIRLDPKFFVKNHSRFVLTNNLRLIIDRFGIKERRGDCTSPDGISSVEFNCFDNNFKNSIVEIKKNYSHYKKLKTIDHVWDSKVKITSECKFIEMCNQNGVDMKVGANESEPNYIYQLLNPIS